MFFTHRLRNAYRKKGNKTQLNSNSNLTTDNIMKSKIYYINNCNNTIEEN